MRMIEAMVLASKLSKLVAGQVVAFMICKGADPEIMRKHGIPTSVYYYVLGGQHWNESPHALAAKMLEQYRPDYIYR